MELAILGHTYHLFNLTIRTLIGIAYLGNSLAVKANQSTTFTKTDVDIGLALKADKSTT